jgi:hypothetical protein
MRWIKIVLLVVIVGLVISVGRGLTGANDRFFVVTLVNHSGTTLSIQPCESPCKRGHDVTEIVAPGRRDLESGSSTAHQTFVVRRPGTNDLASCIDLFFAKATPRTVVLRTLGGSIVATGTPACRL